MKVGQVWGTSNYFYSLHALKGSFWVCLNLIGAQMEVDYTEQLNFSDDDEQGGSSPKEDSRQVREPFAVHAECGSDIAVPSERCHS